MRHVFGTFLVCSCIYASGLVLYSQLFLFTPNQSAIEQAAKIAVAAFHFGVMILPVFLAQSRRALLRLSGYALLAAYFLYLFFLIGYFSYFGIVPEVYAFGWSNTSDLLDVRSHYFAQVFGAAEVVLIAIAVLLVASLRRWRVGRAALILPIAAAALFVASWTQFGAPAQSKTFGNETVVRRFGLPAFLTVSMTEALTHKGGFLAPSTPYPGRLAELGGSTQKPQPTPLTVPRNIQQVLLLQVESLDISAITARLNGRPAMPFVSELRGRCLNYTNAFTLKGVGGSSDAEFAVMTGLVPSARQPAIRYMDYSRIPTLYGQLQKADIQSTFAHNNTIGFYGRNRTYDQIDAVNSIFLEPQAQISERRFAEEALRSAMSDTDRFFFYFFNFQSHGPYRGYNAATQEAFGLKAKGDLGADYLATMSEVDQTLKSLFNMQKEAFAAGESVVILTADHPSQLATTTAPISRNRIPMMLCHRDLVAQDIDKVVSTADLYPTILALFGEPEPEPTIAQSILAPGPNTVLLPSREMITRTGEQPPKMERCGSACDRFFAFTEQHILAR
jgi:phosphoglycerol transferase MdoB-like AlkP superfamily enzyme